MALCGRAEGAIGIIRAGRGAQLSANVLPVTAIATGRQRDRLVAAASAAVVGGARLFPVDFAELFPGRLFGHVERAPDVFP